MQPTELTNSHVFLKTASYFLDEDSVLRVEYLLGVTHTSDNFTESMEHFNEMSPHGWTGLVFSNLQQINNLDEIFTEAVKYLSKMESSRIKRHALLISQQNISQDPDRYSRWLQTEECLTTNVAFRFFTNEYEAYRWLLAGDLTQKNASTTFCVLPWTHVFANQKGQMMPCCFAMNSNKFIKDDDGQEIRIYQKNGIERALNSSYMKDVRQKMLAGEQPDPCRYCFIHEKSGLRSRRQNENKNHPHLARAVLRNAQGNGHSDLDQIKSMDLWLGNVCNLRCRTCNPTQSKGLINEWAEIAEPNYFGDVNELKNMDWFEQDEYWNSLLRYMSHTEEIHLAGGEPFLIKKVPVFLSQLIEQGYSKNIFLKFTSNLTVLPDWITQIWPHFKSTLICASVDGFGDLNSFIRYPSKWDVLDRNLKKLDKIAPELKANNLLFNTAVSVHNIFGLTKLFEYFFTNFSNFKPFPNLFVVTGPEAYDIRILPDKLKQCVRVELQSFINDVDKICPDKWRGGLGGFKLEVEGIIKHMLSEDRTHLIPVFQRFTQVYDSHRRQNLAEVIPEIAELMTYKSSTVFQQSEGQNAE